MNQPSPPVQELMTPQEAARWFRRSISWLRQQADLVRLGARGSQPLYHVDACRAFVLGQMRGLGAQDLRELQLEALAKACRLGEPDGSRIAAVEV